MIKLPQVLAFLCCCFPVNSLCAADDDWIALYPAPDLTPVYPMSQELESALRQRTDPVKSLIEELFRIVPDGRLTEARLAEEVAFRQAAARSRMLQQVLAYDLNANFEIEAEEIARARAHVTGERLSRLEQDIAGADTDGDRTISVSELQAIAATATTEISAHRLDRYGLQYLDANEDGIVTAEDITVTVPVLIDHLPPAMPRHMRHPMSRTEPVCDLPQASANAEVLFVSAREATALSNTSVGGFERPTEVIAIEIEEGDAPLYLVFAFAAPVIVVFEGATDRVEHYAASYSRDDIGVVGLEQEKISMYRAGRCVPSYMVTADNDDARDVLERLGQRIGRPISAVVDARSVGRVTLPSGAMNCPISEETPESPPSGALILHTATVSGIDTMPIQMVEGSLAPIVTTLMDKHPSGLVDVPADLVVASGPVVPYVVLPQEAGLLQLAIAGIVTYDPARDGYLITHRMPHFPSGLVDDHAVTFFLAEGMGLPDGSRGHSSVISERTGDCVRSFRGGPLGCVDE